MTTYANEFIQNLN